MLPRVLDDSQEALVDLVHDLRQPLGTIEYSACYLEMLLGKMPTAVQDQLRLIVQQVDLAAALLARAAARGPHQQVQRTAADESLDLTNSQTAAVT